MAVEESEFFREATLLICGNLDIEKALVQLLRYLQKFMPADRLVLERYDEGLGSIRSIINVTPEGGERGGVPAPLSEEAKTVMKQMYQQGVPEPYYENSPNEDPAARELLDFYKLEASASLGLPLGTSDNEPGGMVLLSERGQYKDRRHALCSWRKPSLWLPSVCPGLPKDWIWKTNHHDCCRKPIVRGAMDRSVINLGGGTADLYSRTTLREC